MSFIIPHNAAFTSWLASNSESMKQEWRHYIASLEEAQCSQELGMYKTEAMALLTDGANEAFREFCKNQFEDSRDFSNSGL